MSLKKGQMAGSLHPQWRGGRCVRANRVLVWCPEHPRAGSKGYVSEHVLVVESVTGRPLPDRAVVHHVNGNPTDNSPSNLVVCEDQSYHMLLHSRQGALLACGNPNYRKCRICFKWDDPKNLKIYPKHRASWHQQCATDAARRRAQQKRA